MATCWREHLWLPGRTAGTGCDKAEKVPEEGSHAAREYLGGAQKETQEMFRDSEGQGLGLTSATSGCQHCV